MSRRIVVATLLLVAGVGMAQTPQNQSPIRTLYFRLGLNRIDPASVTVPAGQYRLRLDNGIVVNKEIPFSVDREGGARLTTSQVAKGATRARAAVTLSPGKYVLQAGGRPGWRSVITVTEPSSGR